MATGKLLRFQFPEHEGLTMKRMNQLRLEEWFCDVTVLVGGLRFPGHRVVLAACSPFLRDRFHMNPSEEVQVSPMASAEVVRRLLLSCYTGALEFPFRDILDYLTAASCLQMEHVVEKCRQSLSPCVASLITEEEAEGAGGGGEAGRPGTPQIASSSGRAPETAGEGPAGWPASGEAVKQEPVATPNPLYRPGPESEAGAGPAGAAGAGGLQREALSLDAPPGYLEPDCCIHSTVEGMGGGGGGGAAEAGADRASGFADGGKAEGMEDEGFVLVRDDLPEEDYESSASEECRSGVGGGGFYAGCFYNRLGEEPPPALAGASAGGARGGEAGEPGLCSECGAPFQHREHLAAHMVVHKLYMCLLCGKVFKKNARLAQHINVHTGFKPYCCAVCGKTFTQNRSLKDHMNVHSGDSPHCCNYCDLRFTHYNTLRVHLRDQHGKTTGKNSTETKLAEINVVLP
uniref:zinc finger and BTB domain-containing protein 12-like n=1 Tax=Pristiophorus japonicus TaxID=55135 RepID=UPI00398EA378